MLNSSFFIFTIYVRHWHCVRLQLNINKKKLHSTEWLDRSRSISVIGKPRKAFEPCWRFTECARAPSTDWRDRWPAFSGLHTLFLNCFNRCPNNPLLKSTNELSKIKLKLLVSKATKTQNISLQNLMYIIRA